MGTNYYAAIDVCPHCKRASRELHIGKRSGGWEFHFQAYNTDEYLEGTAPVPLLTWAHYRAFLAMPDVQVRDEYGETLTLAEFVEIVEETKGQKSHYAYCQEHYPEHAKTLWVDDEGYCFGYGEFS